MFCPKSSIRGVSRARFAARLPPRPTGSQLGRFGRRGYASDHGGHAVKKAGSDLPWAISSIAVTVTACAYLLQPSKSHDHHDDHDEHKDSTTHEDPVTETVNDVQEAAESTKEAIQGASTSEGSDEAGQESKDDDQGAESEDASSHDGESSSSSSDQDSSAGDAMPKSSQASDDEEPSEDEGSGDEKPAPGDRSDPNLPRAKGPTSGPPASSETQHVTTASGSGHKKISSGYGIPVSGHGSNSVEHSDQSPDEPATPAKPAEGGQSQSSKQEGLSNDDTKYSWDLSQDPTLSKKRGEGSVDSAKTKGTVDPFRKQG